MKISDVTKLFREQVFKGCCQSGGRLVLNSVRTNMEEKAAVRLHC